MLGALPWEHVVSFPLVTIGCILAVHWSWVIPFFQPLDCSVHNLAQGLGPSPEQLGCIQLAALSWQPVFFIYWIGMYFLYCSESAEVALGSTVSVSFLPLSPSPSPPLTCPLSLLPPPLTLFSKLVFLIKFLLMLFLLFRLMSKFESMFNSKKRVKDMAAPEHPVFLLPLQEMLRNWKLQRDWFFRINAQKNLGIESQAIIGPSLSTFLCYLI